MNILIISINIRLIKKIRRQVHYFSNRLPYAYKRITEIWIIITNTTYKSSEEKIKNIQELKGKTKSKSKEKISN